MRALEKIRSRNKSKPIAKAMPGVLTRTISFQNTDGRLILLLGGTKVIVDVLMLIAFAQGIHFTIERGEYRLLN